MVLEVRSSAELLTYTLLTHMNTDRGPSRPRSDTPFCRVCASALGRRVLTSCQVQYGPVALQETDILCGVASSETQILKLGQERRQRGSSPSFWCEECVRKLNRRMRGAPIPLGDFSVQFGGSRSCAGNLRCTA